MPPIPVPLPSPPEIIIASAIDFRVSALSYTIPDYYRSHIKFSYFKVNSALKITTIQQN
jgi:hypothetical protein